MADKPSKRQIMEAYLAYFNATSLEQKQQIVEQYKDILLRKYGFWDTDTPNNVSIELMQRQGVDFEAAARHSWHTMLLDDAKKVGVEEAFRQVRSDPEKLKYFTGLPGADGTVLDVVTFAANQDRPHPYLEDGEIVELVAFPDYLEVRKYRGKEELVTIPWNNLQDISAGTQRKGDLTVAKAVNFLTPAYMGSLHDGVKIVYLDAAWNSKLVLFFRVKGEKKAQELAKKLMHRWYEYRKRMV